MCSTLRSELRKSISFSMCCLYAQWRAKVLACLKCILKKHWQKINGKSTSIFIFFTFHTSSSAPSRCQIVTTLLPAARLLNTIAPSYFYRFGGVDLFTCIHCSDVTSSKYCRNVEHWQSDSQLPASNAALFLLSHHISWGTMPTLVGGPYCC